MAALSTSASMIFSCTKIPHPRMTIRPLSSIQQERRMQVPYELKAGQSRLFHKLSSGLNMEVIFQEGRRHKISDREEHVSRDPPLVFIHGSYHAAWCWAERWLPYLSQNGYDCYALSLLGQGESDAPAGAVAGTLQTHAGDVADFIQKELKVPPILVGHSFGGLIVQYYIANLANDKSQENEIHPFLAGAVLVCSVPPSGNGGIVWRYILSKPITAFKVTLSLAAKAFQTSLPLCRETYFSASMEDELVLRYQNLMKESSRMPLFDLRKLNASLPVPSSTDPSLEVFVLGAKDDFIVDVEGLQETGRFYGVTPVCIEGIAHDMMLDCSWEKGADVLLSWLSSLENGES